MVEPIIRCINAFYDNSNIVRYFVTLLGIISILEQKGLISLLCSVARQFQDDYTRIVFLYIFDMLSNCMIIISSHINL